MRRITITGSSNIDSIGYDEDVGVLQVKFHHGGIYDYTPITKGGYESFLSSESKGKFFAEHIKNNKDIICRRVD